MVDNITRKWSPSWVEEVICSSVLRKFPLVCPPTKCAPSAPSRTIRKTTTKSTPTAHQSQTVSPVAHPNPTPHPRSQLIADDWPRWLVPACLFCYPQNWTRCTCLVDEHKQTVWILTKRYPDWPMRTALKRDLFLKGVKLFFHWKIIKIIQSQCALS